MLIAQVGTQQVLFEHEIIRHEVEDDSFNHMSDYINSLCLENLYYMPRRMTPRLLARTKSTMMRRSGVSGISSSIFANASVMLSCDR